MHWRYWKENNHWNQRLTTICDIASFLKKMKPETARNTSLILLVTGIRWQIIMYKSQQSNTSRIQRTEQASLFCFSSRFFNFYFSFFDCLYPERSHLAADKFYKWVFGSNFLFEFPISCFLFSISYFLFPISYFLFPVSCFLFPVSCFLFPISYFLFPVRISYFEFLVRISKIVWWWLLNDA